MLEYLEQVSLTEQENIKKVIQDLFRQTCILKIKYDPETLVAKDNERYHICNRHRAFIEDYLQVLDCQLYHDPMEHIFRIQGDGVPVKKIGLTTTKILLLLKLIYREKIMGEGLQASVTNLEELRSYGMQTGLLTERLPASEWNQTLQLLKRHQILEIPGAISNLTDDTPMYIYSTIHLYCPTKEINEMIQLYKGEQEEEEINDESEEDMQTIMFD